MGWSLSVIWQNKLPDSWCSVQEQELWIISVSAFFLSFFLVFEVAKKNLKNLICEPLLFENINFPSCWARMKTYFHPCAIPQLSRVYVCRRVLMYEMSRVPESVIVLEHPCGPEEFWDVQLQLVKCGNATRVFPCVCAYLWKVNLLFVHVCVRLCLHFRRVCIMVDSRSLSDRCPWVGIGGQQRLWVIGWSNLPIPTPNTECQTGAFFFLNSTIIFNWRQEEQLRLRQWLMGINSKQQTMDFKCLLTRTSFRPRSGKEIS